jgi:hypothetical protein
LPQTSDLYADRIEVSPSGALVAYGGYRAEGESGPKETMPIYAIAAGEWSTFYAASCISGEMVAANL